MYRIAMIVVMGGLLLGASRCNKDEPKNDDGEQPMEGGGASGAGGSSAGGSAGSSSHDPGGGGSGKGGGPISGGSGGSSSGSGGSSSGGTAGSKSPPPADAPHCGGIAARPCPGLGSCVDDPSDSCDPKKGGADCGGICKCSALAKCRDGQKWDASPSVCACVPADGSGGSSGGDAGNGGSSDAGSGVECGTSTCAAGETCCNASCGICTKPGEGCTKQLCPPPTDPDPNPVHCGGFAGLPCPGSGECVDDPSDGCDPQNGGADCGGICTCMGPATVLCIQGSEWNSDPHVCACAPTSGGGGSTGQQCGKTTCPADQTCCNASCGICAPKGGACIQIACF